VRFGDVERVGWRAPSRSGGEDIERDFADGLLAFRTAEARERGGLLFGVEGDDAGVDLPENELFAFEIALERLPCFFPSELAPSS